MVILGVIFLVIGFPLTIIARLMDKLVLTLVGGVLIAFGIGMMTFFSIF